MISRTAQAALRKALSMPGRVELRHNPVLQVLGARMMPNGLAPKAVVGAAMRKLVHLIYGVVNFGKPFDADFAMTRTCMSRRYLTPEFRQMFVSRRHPRSDCRVDGKTNRTGKTVAGRFCRSAGARPLCVRLRHGRLWLVA